MSAPVRAFLDMQEEEQTLYLFGRRTGIFNSLADLSDSELRGHAELTMAAHRVNSSNVEDWAAQMIQRFI
jgi:hypothetical protein